VELTVDRRVFQQISDVAIEYKTGARSLRGLFEELITPILYTVPDDPGVKKVEIDSLFTEPRYLRN
jgi:ATP-dependent Clp protease ATP-binding subunit ClpX